MDASNPFVVYREARETFARDGVVHVPAFLGPSEVAALRENLERYIRDIAPTLTDGTVIRAPLEGGGTMVRVLENLPIDPFFDTYGRSPRWLALGEALLGDPVTPAVVDEYSRFGWQAYFDMPPKSVAHTPPHQDNFYYKFEPADTLSIWVALDPVDDENGGMQYVRGSHLEPFRPHGPGPLAGFSQVVTDFGPEDAARQVSFRLAPGDAVVHHGKMIHAAPPNRSQRHRRGFSMFLRSVRCRRDEAAYAEYIASLARHNDHFGLSPA